MANSYENDKGLEANGPAVSHTPDTGDGLLEELEKDFERLKAQKARPTGGVEGSVLLHLSFLDDEQYTNYKNKTLSLEAQDANKLYLTFNLITPRWNKLLGRLSAFNAPFKARPNKKDPQALEEAEIVDRMTIALDEKLDDPSRLRETLWWMGVGGTSFRHITWIPNATIEPNPQFDEAGELLFKFDTPDGPMTVTETERDEMIEAGMYPPEAFEVYEEVELVGEVGDETLNPLQVFIDQTVRSVQDLAPDQWVHVAVPRTLGWIKENFNEDVEPQSEINIITSKIRAEGESGGGRNLKDLIPLIQGSCDENDPKMALVIQSYQCASTDQPKGRYVCWIPKDRILHDADNPYEEIPLVDFHWSPVTTSFWTKGYIAPLIAPQRFINKRMSQLGEQSNAAIYSNILLGGGLKAGDIPADFPGVVENGIDENGMPNIQRTPPPELGSWFLPSIEMAVKMFNDSAGGADLMEDNKFPGQLRGPMAVPMLQEIMDTQWGPLFAHLGERLSRVKQMRLNRVKQFYPPLRTLHYTSKDQRDEVITFHTEEVLRSGTNFSITVERGAMMPELRALREARVSERMAGPLAILYMDERTGRPDKSKIAADLQFGDVGREARESQYRKLALEIIKMLWSGKTLPPVQPFYDHGVMLDELESAMATTEFLKASPQIQQIFSDRWSQHTQYLQQEAMAQQQSMQNGMIHNAVAQATQQAAATAAAQAIEQASFQQQAQNAQPTDQYMAQAQAQAQAGAQAQQVTEQRAPKPKAKSRKITLEEKGGD